MRIRTAGPADADEIVQVRSASWRAAYSGIMSAAVLAQLPEVAPEHFVRSLARRGDGSITLVAEKGPNVIGFVSVGWDTRESSEETAVPGTPGEIWAIYVHPDHWGRGAGRALMREGQRWLAERELLPIRAWELVGNAIGRRFYERCGFEADGAEDTYAKGGESYPIERLSLPQDRLMDELR
jgi:ribosomal protein S18 acetylase RimI-like enzyme